MHPGTLYFDSQTMMLWESLLGMFPRRTTSTEQPIPTPTGVSAPPLGCLHLHPPPAPLQPQRGRLPHLVQSPAPAATSDPMTTPARTTTPTPDTTLPHRQRYIRRSMKRHKEAAAPTQAAPPEQMMPTDAHVSPQEREDPLKFARVPGLQACLLYTSPSPRDRQKSRMPSSA